MAGVNVVEYFAIYGVQRDFYFAAEDPTDANDLYLGNAWAAGDAEISKDGGAEAATANVPARITTRHHKITLSAAELSANEVLVTIRDQTEPEVFLPVIIHITTRLKLGSLDCDATGIGGGSSAMTLIGYLGGDGLYAQGGATGHGFEIAGGASGHGIWTSSPANHGFFAYSGGNGNGIYAQSLGAGVGIKGISGTGQICNFFDTSESTEPTAAESVASIKTMRTMLQVLARRALNKKTLGVGLLTVKKDDSVTTLFTQSVTNDGTTVTETKAI